MNTLEYILVFSVLGGIISLIGGVVLLQNKKSAKLLAKYATPFAGGALLAAVFLDLLPEGIAVDSADDVLLATLAGIIVFFLAEGFLHWFHHHHEHGDKTDPKKWLIIVGDTMHNALDGVAIAASFLISVPTGIVTTIAVAAHEIPQEIGDFGLLLSKGMRRRNVLLVNVASALTTVVFALLTYWVGSEEALPIGVLLGLSAGFLLYIATSDVIPAIHEKNGKHGKFATQAMLLLAGVLLVGIVNTVAHSYIDAGHDHSEDAEHSLVEDLHDDEDHHEEEHEDESHLHEEEKHTEEDHHDE